MVSYSTLLLHGIVSFELKALEKIKKCERILIVKIICVLTILCHHHFQFLSCNLNVLYQKVSIPYK